MEPKTPQPNTIDDILNMIDGGIHGKGSDRGGYPTYFTEPYPLWSLERKRWIKAALLEAIKGCIGEDEIANRNEPSEYTRIARNQLRSEQRDKLISLFGGKE